jgi:hypothetical protein
MKLGKPLNANKYELQSPVSHNLNFDPSDPIEGQWYYNKITKRLRYWSSTTGVGLGWIELGTTGITSINLTNEVSGTWVGGTISVTAENALITNRPETSVLNGNSYFLYYDSVSGGMAKIKWSTISDYIDTKVAPSYSITSDTTLGDASIVLSDGILTSTVRIAGTTNEIEVVEDSVIANRIIVGLPNSVTISSISVTTLTVNGVPYSPYVHPTHSANTIDGSGLQFVQDFTSDSQGHVTGVSLGTVPSATTTVVGAMRFATSAELAAGASGVAVQPSQLSGAGGTVSGTVGYVPVFTGTTAIGNSIIRQAVSTVAVGMAPDVGGEKLQVNGNVMADGYKTPANDPSFLLTSDGGFTRPADDIIINGDGRLVLQPLNLVASGNYTIPSTKNALIYLTYDTVGVATINLPTTAHLGQRIYVMSVNPSSGTCTINGGLATLELDKDTCWVLYYNGTNWIAIGRHTLTMLD